MEKKTKRNKRKLVWRKSFLTRPPIKNIKKRRRKKKNIAKSRDLKMSSEFQGRSRFGTGKKRFLQNNQPPPR